MRELREANMKKVPEIQKPKTPERPQLNTLKKFKNPS
jgi:hypothetical protein